MMTLPRDDSPEQQRRRRDRRQLKLKRRELIRIWRRLETCKTMKMRPLFAKGPDHRRMARLEEEIYELDRKVNDW